MGKEVPAHLQGLAIGLVLGATTVIYHGGQSLYALALVAFVLGTVAYGLEKRGERNEA